MFGLQKYIDKIYSIRWKFHISMKEELEQKFCVELEQTDEDEFKIVHIHYTYVDILEALENMNFHITKFDDNIVIKLIDI